MKGVNVWVVHKYCCWHVHRSIVVNCVPVEDFGVWLEDNIDIYSFLDESFYDF